MRWRFAILLAAVLMALLPGVTLAQGTADQGDLLLRVNGPLDLPAGQEAGTVVVVNHDATIAGTVHDALVMVNNTAVVTGRVDGDVTIINGRLDLRSGAQVHNVSLVNSTITRAPDAVITGTSSTTTGFRWGWGSTLFSYLAWLAFTIVVVVAGLVFAAVGGRQLTDAGRLIVRQPGETILTAILSGVIIIGLAIAAFVTLIGIPLGVALLIFLMPVLWFLGYLVGGTELGIGILQAAGRRMTGDHPYLAAVVGLIILQAIGLIPVVGGLITFLVGVVGAGALVLLALRAWRGRPERPAPAERVAPTA